MAAGTEQPGTLGPDRRVVEILDVATTTRPPDQRRRAEADTSAAVADVASPPGEPHAARSEWRRGRATESCRERGAAEFGLERFVRHYAKPWARRRTR
jgi:hypothetical protein